MKLQLRTSLLPLILAALGLGPAHAADAPRIGGELTCNGPVSDKDTGESLYQRYGEQATLGDFRDPNYNSFIEVELFSSEAQLDVKLADDDFVKNVVAVEVSPGVTAWSVNGVKMGMSLEDVAAINGGPFKFWMTGLDTKGSATFPGGRLDKLDGGCRLKVGFAFDDHNKIAQTLSGKEISSDNQELQKLRPTVSELSILWPRTRVLP